MTLPVIRALAAADAAERAFWARVIGKGEQRDGDLEQAMALMARHGEPREHACDDGAGHAARARAALAPLPEGGIRRSSRRWPISWWRGSSELRFRRWSRARATRVNVLILRI